jgi:Zinc dependent phospholipase C
MAVQTSRPQGGVISRLCGVAACLAFLLASAAPLASYSVLTHEEVIDLLWEQRLKPILLQRYPQATPEQLRAAHAYAYGGSLIQDMGYYPFGNKKFSDLVHYVRSGDFVVTLINDSSDLNEYAFALGALAHYAADLTGHPAVNEAVALHYPKLRRRFGNSVTYADNAKAHIRTEFGFDVTQVAKRRFASDTYHDFIGFEVAKPLLERAFRETYGFELADLFKSFDLALGTYRRSVSMVIPEMTRVALLSKRADIVRETPNFDRKKFLYRLSRAQYEKQWGNTYKRPGLGARFLAFLFRLVPKVGAFKAINFSLPSQRTETMYLHSVNQTLDYYSQLLAQLEQHRLTLANRDFDTGRETRAAEYPLTDDSYADLLDRIAQRKFEGVTPELRNNILQFYANLNVPFATKKHSERWQKAMHELDELRAVKTASQPRPPAGSE